MDASAKPPKRPCAWIVQREGGERPCGLPARPDSTLCSRHLRLELDAKKAVLVMLSNNAAGFALVLEKLVEQRVLTWSDIARVARTEELLDGLLGSLY